MANTFTQIHIHAVFAVQNRECLISQSLEEELFKYIMGIIKTNNHKPLAINGASRSYSCIIWNATRTIFI